MLVVAAMSVVMLLTTSCAMLQPKPAEVTIRTILLSEIFFRGELAGFVVPQKFGDFSVTHSFAGVMPAGEGVVLIEYIPSGEPGWIFQLWVKSDCPEAIALSAYNMKTETAEYYIYKEYLVPIQVTKAEYDEVLAQEHFCIPPKMET